MSATTSDLSTPATTGIPGLDEILHGGLPRERLYLVRGQPGTGKTTLALQFLLAGVQQGETGLYFTLAETAAELRQVADSHGWELDDSFIHELSATALTQTERRQTIFPSSEVELDELFEVILQQLDQRQPKRVVFDPITEIRLLSGSALRFRRQLLLLRQQLLALGCTTLFLSDEVLETVDEPPVSLVHGVITLKRTVPVYGSVQRTLEVTKLRGLLYSEGNHDFQIRPGGLVVFPRLQVSTGRDPVPWDLLSSGVPEVDALLGGGLETGTACLISGQAGTGKSTVALLYAYAAARRGQPVAIFLFDERIDTWYHRAQRMGLDLPSLVAQGLVQVHQVNTGELTPGEFAYRVRQLVEQTHTKVLVLDSLSGYLQAMSQQQLLLLQMHELLTYLGQQGVLTLLLVTQHGLFDRSTRETLDLSYLTDTVLLMRHFEAAGALHQAISVLKKRHSRHERTIREISMTASGVQVGAPLTAFSGVLTGTPQYEGTSELLSSHSPFKHSLAPAEQGE